MSIRGRVRLLGDAQWVHDGSENAGVPVDIEPIAIVRNDGVNLVLTSTKVAPGDLRQLKSVGIDPSQQKIIVVKAAVRWRGGDEPIPRHSINVGTPGLGSVDLRRTIFPLDSDATWPHA